MKAVLWTAYGPPDVLCMGEIEQPVPKGDQLLIRVYAAGVTLGDCELRSLSFPLWLRLPIRLYAGIRKPTRITVLGQEFAGVVERVGPDVKGFQPGDSVLGGTGMTMGSYAEYICLSEAGSGAALAPKPADLPFAQAATIATGGLEAIHFLRLAALRPGERMLINGSGGSIGTYALQMAKRAGAVITAVDSGEKLDFLRRLGADEVIDYTQQDFTRSGRRYDVIFDVVGKSHYGRSLKCLTEDGRYLIANPTPAHMLRSAIKRGGRRVYTKVSARQSADLVALAQMLERGEIKPALDRCYPLEEAISAHRYVEAGRKKGNIALIIAAESEQTT
ncbi:MAG: NAD(P)-dependent alcohol dehydrogenase [Caldilineaceae bacterium]|nr:NAD(P)-dependent alcohol dehydrogenase [Caldilineaceae bacterium]